MLRNRQPNTLITCLCGTLTSVSVFESVVRESVLICSEYAPLAPFDHVEHGKDADPSFPNLLKTAKVTQFTSNIGAEVTGVQLSQLTKEGKDELALFVAQNKVVGKSNAILLPWPSTKQFQLSVTKTLPTSQFKRR